MSTEGMVGELPKACDVGAKRNAKGYWESWRGYRLHIDAADGDVPVSRVLTSASLHDSQAAIPLARMTAERVDHRYGLMDAVCDSREIGAHARMAGRVAIIDANPRHDRVRHGQRSSGGRVNSALKDSYGGRHVRVRGHVKVACHLFFGAAARARTAPAGPASATFRHTWACGNPGGRRVLAAAAGYWPRPPEPR